MDACMHVSMYVFVCVGRYVWMHACMKVCMCLYAGMYVRTYE